MKIIRKTWNFNEEVVFKETIPQRFLWWTWLETRFSSRPKYADDIELLAEVNCFIKHEPVTQILTFKDTSQFIKQKDEYHEWEERIGGIELVYVEGGTTSPWHIGLNNDRSHS